MTNRKFIAFAATLSTTKTSSPRISAKGFCWARKVLVQCDGMRSSPARLFHRSDCKPLNHIPTGSLPLLEHRRVRLLPRLPVFRLFNFVSLALYKVCEALKLCLQLLPTLYIAHRTSTFLNFLSPTDNHAYQIRQQFRIFTISWCLLQSRNLVQYSTVPAIIPCTNGRDLYCTWYHTWT